MPSVQEKRSYGPMRLAIDRGGTFTDVHATWPCDDKDDPQVENGIKEIVLKLLSQNPDQYQDAPREGIRRALEIQWGKEISRKDDLDTSTIESIRMGTTVATNALLERKGEKHALVITKGFRDLLEIGNQSRPKIFDLSISKPDVLYESVLEIDERVTLVGYDYDPNQEENKPHFDDAGKMTKGPGHKGRSESIKRDVPDADAIEDYALQGDIFLGKSGEAVRITRALDEDKVRKHLEDLYHRDYRSLAIVLMHAYTYPRHEEVIGTIAKDIGFTQVSLSSQLMPMIKIVPRGTSTTADAYLTPKIKEYIDTFRSGFADNLKSKDEGGTGTQVQFMQSDGGLVTIDRFSGLHAILSGPAGGVVGIAETSWSEKKQVPIIGFDMGGTSTDVSRFAGSYEHVFETTTAGVTIQSPQLDINTVAAGGGSRLFWRNDMLAVGPESAGAHPGPACYRKGGPLAVTDANAILGRLLPDYFPKIFGDSEDQPLDIEQSRKLFKELADKINAATKSDKSLEEMAFGFIKVANEAMCRPIRSLTEARGNDSSKHALGCFGGAAGQHACAVASNLGISTILVHKYGSILSAHGMSLADVVVERQQPTAAQYSKDSISDLRKRIESMSEECRHKLEQEGFNEKSISYESYFNMRYDGTDTTMMIRKPEDSWDFEKPFLDTYKSEYGFTLTDRKILVDDVRVRGIGKADKRTSENVFEEMERLEKEKAFKDVPKDCIDNERPVYFEGGSQKTPICRLSNLPAKSCLAGPALIIDETQTIVVEPNFKAFVTTRHVVMKRIDGQQESKADSVDKDKADPVLLSVFGHRYMAIAEIMGRSLQRTSVSTNIKERLDFSCAIFNPDGELVANAPHLPVHLGSMSYAIKYQLQKHKDTLKEGDVLVTNHPTAGGTHLPDITVITPCFQDGKIIFAVASRGHHADIGGILPGSMPPTSQFLYQEGAQIKSFKLVSQGTFDRDGISKLLLDDPAQYPDCSGTRCLRDNLSDLQAQIAANKKGIELLHGLVKEYSLPVVQAYMIHIKDNAEAAVRNLLRSVAKDRGTELHAIDYMDDGSAIELSIRIDTEKGSALFDFEGTGPEVLGNLNAPSSVCYSAIIYCLRCMVTDDIPLNQGCLTPVDVKIPANSLLDPSEHAAVVGGNVVTSQRVTDVVFRAFEACAASQGDTNNLTFGNNNFGYYETIAGGSGAGPTWHGTSGVHTHMTNTRITDPEIMERRYPVLLREFSLRKGSGGQGQYSGGDGVTREIEFLEPCQVSILSERRTTEPYGLAGGESAKRGINQWLKPLKDKDSVLRTISLGPRNTVLMSPGQRVKIMTPGGGGWGRAEHQKDDNRKDSDKVYQREGGSVASFRSAQEGA